MAGAASKISDLTRQGLPARCTCWEAYPFRQTMKSLRLLLAALLATTLLSSCETPADSRQPTVSQQDANDVSWGLTPRKARGNPKMRYQYNARAEQTAAPMSVDPAASGDSALTPTAARADRG